MAKIAELETQIEQMQQQLDNVRIISIAYDIQGRLLRVAVSPLDTVAALKATKNALAMVAMQTDELLLAAVEREAKSDDAG